MMAQPHVENLQIHILEQLVVDNMVQNIAKSALWQLIRINRGWPAPTHHPWLGSSLVERRNRRKRVSNRRGRLRMYLVGLGMLAEWLGCIAELGWLGAIHAKDCLTVVVYGNVFDLGTRLDKEGWVDNGVSFILFALLKVLAVFDPIL